MEIDVIGWLVLVALAGLGAWVAYKWVKKRGGAVVDAATGKKEEETGG